MRWGLSVPLLGVRGVELWSCWPGEPADPHLQVGPAGQEVWPPVTVSPGRRKPGRRFQQSYSSRPAALTPRQHQRLLGASIHLQPPGEEAVREGGREGGLEWVLDSLPDNKCFQVPGEHSVGHSRI